MTDLNEIASHCPACGAEYRSGFEACADDGTPLVPGPGPIVDEPAGPEAPRWDGTPGPPWEAVAELRSEEQAHLLAGRLNAEGIEAFLDPPEQMRYYGTRPVRILVPPHRVLEAADVIRRLDDEQPDDEDDA